MSRAAQLVDISTARSDRLLGDVAQFDGGDGDGRAPVVDRLADTLGRDLAEQVVGMLSKEAAEWVDAALTPAFARRLAALADERARAA